MLTPLCSKWRSHIVGLSCWVCAAGSLAACSSPKADTASGSAPSAAEQGSGQGTPAAEALPTPVDPVSPTEPPLALDPTTPTESAPATSESTEAALTMEDRVKPIVASVTEAKLLFVACDQTPCTLRAQTPTLTGMRDLLAALSREFEGRIAFTVREHLDAYTGRSFQTDLELDVNEGARPVPADENQLLTPQ